MVTVALALCWLGVLLLGHYLSCRTSCNRSPSFLHANFQLLKLSTVTFTPQHLRSFANSIQHYRMEESKRILRVREQEYLSPAGIAFECGFNSPSSFDVYVKKNRGITPLEFKKAPNKVLPKALGDI